MALRASGHDAGEYLFRAIREIGDEPLDPGWLKVWKKGGRLIREMFSPDMREEIEARIKAIVPIDPEIAELTVSTSARVCLLLGAGASAPPPSSIPTVSDLLPQLWRRARKLGRDDIDRLADWCAEREIRNIEDLLTAAYLANFAAKNSNVSGLLDYFLFKSTSRALTEDPRLRASRGTFQVDASSIALLQDTLQGLFGLLTGIMIPAAPNAAHGAVVEFVRSHPNAAIVTTNYDGCIDEALTAAGVSVRTHLESSSSATEEGGVDLLKIHGSINWSYCDSCHDVRAFDLLEQKRAFNDDTHSYAILGICRKCGGQRRPLLIPPLGFKFVMFPSLIRLWDRARDTIESSELVVVVGYSFSEADSYINKIIERSMTMSSTQRLLVVDPNPSLVDGLRLRFASRIDGFDERRILRAGASAADLLPKILKTLCASPKASRQDEGSDLASTTPLLEVSGTSSEA